MADRKCRYLSFEQAVEGAYRGYPPFVSKKQKEALMSNLHPRVRTDEQGNLNYSPVYNSLRTKDDLMALLKKHHLEGRGAVLHSELKDSCPPEIVRKLVQNIPDVIVIPTGVCCCGCGVRGRCSIMCLLFQSRQTEPTSTTLLRCDSRWTRTSSRCGTRSL